MARAIQFDPIHLPPEADRLREEVREFLRGEIAAGAKKIGRSVPTELLQ